MDRRTKIVCTLGPTSSDPDTIQALVRAGMDVARMNFSHGSHEEHEERVRRVREAAQKEGRVVTILQDLQGPKIRVGEMKDGSVMLREGQEVTITTEPMEESTSDRIYVDYENLPQDAEVGGRILIDDGLLELQVTEVRDSELLATVVEGGALRSRKGVNLPNIPLSTPSLTEKDLKDLEMGLQMDVDAIALSPLQRAHCRGPRSPQVPRARHR